jgi:hypothetical protein
LAALCVKPQSTYGGAMAKKKTLKKAKIAKKPKKAVKPVRKTAKPKLARSVAQKAQDMVKDRLTELLDRRLLDIATKQYSRVLREVAKGRKKIDRAIDDEKRLALQLGERIIAKAREVKQSLLPE